ncbi:DUF6973 domain-containing protein [Robertkochia flava]|uniref:DUF6973 domain-containing protein n=1 Tax=Robertkochia flava TaxID=3447986 RepID=UPI001CCBA9A3|nr:hypothetical protein [Robertkochia marina]
MKGSLKLLKILQWKQFKGVSGFFFRHPLLFLSAITATGQCLLICDRMFGKSHHKNNKANAFRHALWNMMLMRNAFVVEKNSEKVRSWVKSLTDWHETFSPNPPLARSMDLHNNAAGRQLYLQNFDRNGVKNSQLTQALLPLLKTARKINSTEELHRFPGELIYIKDEK